MSQFEYVSIATALVYSFAVARLLAGLPHTSAKSSGVWVALLWNVSMTLGALMAWWIFWRFNDVAWTPLRFVWIVSAPGFVYLRAATLLTDNPSQISDWDQHFMTVRRRFFGIGIPQAFHTGLTPWVLGSFAWFAPRPSSYQRSPRPGSFTRRDAEQFAASTPGARRSNDRGRCPLSLPRTESWRSRRLTRRCS